MERYKDMLKMVGAIMVSLIIGLGIGLSPVEAGLLTCGLYWLAIN